MLKKIFILMFIGVIYTTSVVVNSVSNVTANNTNNITIATSHHKNISPAATTVANKEANYTASQGIDNMENNTPSTAWLLAMALFGFVLLSNRWSI